MTFRLPQRLELIKINNVLILPLKDGVEIPALPINAEVGEGVGLALDPRLSHDISRCSAHEVLQDDVQAVRGVHSVKFGELAVGVLGAEVVLKVQVAADGIEAVDLVKDVELSNVLVGAEAEVVGVSGCAAGV